ncbi:MAG: hypothetical protein JEZ07_14670 [Phycisphaerae bacterium]|nr:hypothetical protein [Phycisphaerae bacterium]
MAKKVSHNITAQMRSAVRAGLNWPNCRDRALNYLKTQLNSDGGFKDRSGNSDIYYSVFGLEINAAADDELMVSQDYYQHCSEAIPDDLVSLSSLVRSLVHFPIDITAEIIARIEAFRSRDGGYHQILANNSSSIYGSFLAVGAYQDLGVPIKDSQAIIASINALKTDDDGFVNDLQVPIAAVPSTAAAVMLLSQLDQQIPQNCAAGLLSCYRDGGFVAMAMLDQPDLLSTAVALFALQAIGYDYQAIKPEIQTFARSLMQPDGSFAANIDEPQGDIEYSFYGLATLGLCQQ